MFPGHEKRKNYFIKKEFQTDFILKFCGLVVLASIVSSIIVFLHLAMKGTMTTAFVDSRLSIITTADYILPVLINTGFITIILVGIATAVTVMYLTHRIAGPLFRVEKSIEEISAGNLDLKINMRSTDEIRKMEKCINEMTGNFRGRILKMKDASSEMSKHINSLSKNASGNLQNELDELSNQMIKLHEALDYFKATKPQEDATKDETQN